MLAFIQQFIHYVLHIDTYLFNFVSLYGVWTYAALFAIIFCETGLVILPFLPGDSLLFVAGSIAANPHQPLSIQLLLVLLLTASILGNKVNYLIGKAIGPKVFAHHGSSKWLINREYLHKTQQFYARHGGKTIIFARFIPIIRTFAPFVAGVGGMKMSEFAFYNVISAILWIGSLLGLGYFFGSLPIIKDHFAIVIYGIIVASLLPAAISLIYHKFTGNCR